MANRLGLAISTAGLLALITGCPGSDDEDMSMDDASGSESGEGSSGSDETDDMGESGGSGDSGGMVGDGAWDCLGAVEPPAFEAGEAQVVFTVADFPGGGGIADLTLDVCAVDDVDCASPFDSGVTSADGVVDVAVPTDAPSYFQVLGDGIAPSLFFRRGEAPPSDPFEVEIGGLSPGTLTAFAGVVGAANDPERGHLVLTGRDCNAELAAGLQFEVDTADEVSTTAYLDGALPSTDTTETDVSGRAGVLDVPPGPVVVRSILAETGETVATREVFVRPGHITLIGMIPTP